MTKKVNLNELKFLISNLSKDIYLNTNKLPEYSRVVKSFNGKEEDLSEKTALHKKLLEYIYTLNCEKSRLQTILSKGLIDSGIEEKMNTAKSLRSYVDEISNYGAKETSVVEIAGLTHYTNINGKLIDEIVLSKRNEANQLSIEIDKILNDYTVEI